MAEFVPPTPQELNQHFLGYEILNFIAQGGMGAVYMAQQTSLERPVAIKILPPELGNDRSYLASFESEAKSLAKLNHSNLVGIYDFGVVNNMYFIIMEYVPGRSLYYTAHGHAVDELEAAFLIAEICKGLEHAHEHGILHRDIKPANILIDEEACPMLVDFGLAKPVSDQNHQGVIFGTPGYTAPEVVQNPHQVDHRADIFSVGVMLYELLTGGLPGEPFIPASQANDTDPRFDRIIQKAMHPLVTLRYSSCAQMAQELDDLIVNWEQEAAPAGGGHGTKILASAASAGSAIATYNATLATNQSGQHAAAQAMAMQQAAAQQVMANQQAAMHQQMMVNQQMAVASGHHPVSSPTPVVQARPMQVKSSSNTGLIVTLIVLLVVISGVALLVVQHNKQQQELADEHEKKQKEAAILASQKETAERLRKKEKRDKEKAEKRDKEIRKFKAEREKAEKEKNRLEAQHRREEAQKQAAAEEARQKAEEEARIAAENAETKNGPNAISFNVSDYINKSRAIIIRAMASHNSSLAQALTRNISDLGDAAEEKVEKLPRKPRAEALEIVEEVMKQLKREQKLPGNPPDDANAFLLALYPEALEKQNKLLQKHDETLAQFHTQYIQAIQSKIEELKKTENNLEAEALDQELENTKKFAEFKSRLF